MPDLLNSGEVMFRYRHVCIESISYVLPEEVVTSTELEAELRPVYDRFGLHEGRLELMTGIRERRFWSEGALPSDGSIAAGRKALAAAGVTGHQVECLIHGSVSRDFLEPATASVVHERLGIAARSVFYDVSNACLGFVNGMIHLGNMIELGQIKRGLIVACESSRQLVRSTLRHLLSSPGLTRHELKTALASLTIGSGAAAMVLAHDSVARADHRLLGGAARSATQYNELCRGSTDTGFADDASMVMHTDSERLLEAGCPLAAETWKDLCHTLAWRGSEVDRIFCHQVGAVHRDRLYAALGLDLSRDFSTFELLGNVGSVSLPLTLAMGVTGDPPPRGARMAMLGIGSGLCCVMLGIEW